MPLSPSAKLYFGFLARALVKLSDSLRKQACSDMNRSDCMRRNQATPEESIAMVPP